MGFWSFWFGDTKFKETRQVDKDLNIYHKNERLIGSDEHHVHEGVTQTIDRNGHVTAQEWSRVTDRSSGRENRGERGDRGREDR